MGLTGGLASGKSLVARTLALRGVPVCDADRLVHRSYRPGGEGAVAVEREFGAAMLAEDGSVDRDALARRVVGDGTAIDRLNRIVHPLVRASVREWLDELSRRPEPPRVAVVEAALLVETGSYLDYDVLLLVWCRSEQQLARAVLRGTDEARARGLLGAQMDLADKRDVAHVVIDNSGGLDDLPAEVDRAWRAVLDLCSSHSSGGSNHSV